MVNLREPEACVARLSRLAGWAATANRRLVGSPVTIASIGLRTSFSNLSMLMREGFEQYDLHTPEA